MGCFQFSITCEQKYAWINYETSQVLNSVYDIQLNRFLVSQVLKCTSVPIVCCSYSLKKIHVGDSHDWRPFIYGGFSSCTAEFGIIDSYFFLCLHKYNCILLFLGTFPIDTTKTRLQIQGQKLDGRFTVVRYNGMFHALSRITREEGVRALYSGYVKSSFVLFHFSYISNFSFSAFGQHF